MIDFVESMMDVVLLFLWFFLIFIIKFLNSVNDSLKDVLLTHTNISKLVSELDKLFFTKFVEILTERGNKVVVRINVTALSLLVLKHEVV